MAQNKQKGAAAAKKLGEALEREREVLQERSAALRFEFVVSELDLAITFCHSAAATRDPERSRKNKDRADEAYSSARHFLERDGLSEPMRQTVQSKVFELESLLRDQRRQHE